MDMAKLAAATVSNQVVRKKRKRKETEEADQAESIEDVADDDHNAEDTHPTATTTTTIPTKSHDGGNKPKRTPKKPTLKRQDSSQVTECAIPWPEHFTRLSNTHRALNLVFTFCCTRKHLATTFETIKSAVESHTKRDLQIIDIAEIKTLISQAVFFAYVDESKLQVNLLGEDKSFRSKGSKIGGLPPLDSVGREDEVLHEDEFREVLLFEFIDGDLKRQVQHAKTGEPTKATQKLRQEDLKMPVYSQKQMLNLIEKRNAKFTSAINKFINDCVEEKLDPMLTLQERVREHVPKPTDFAKEQEQRQRQINLPSSIPSERKTIPEIIAEIKTQSWDEARIIFTNPDMLHITILPQEDLWRTFLKNLKYVVVDELHVYNGLFGSHVAFIMRRLRRICAAIGNRHVKFISCSATVANPEEHMKTIFGVDEVKLTDFDGSPSGRKEFVCWNTPFKDPKDPTSGRGDAMAEAARLFCQLILRERMTLDKSSGFYHCADRFRPQPSRFVAIRDTEEDHFAIVNTTGGRNEVLEELEASRAFFTIYEGGIFLHQGHSYMVASFLPERMMATVYRVNVDWTTQQRDFTDIDPCELEAVRRLPSTALNRTSPSRAFYGTIKIKQNVFGFFKLDKRRRILDAVEVDNPPIILFSKGMWLDVPRSALEILNGRRLNVAAAIHAAEHAVLSLMPNYVVSMPGDMKTECKVAVKEFAKKESSRKRPARLTFYDAKGGASGSGISTKAFEFVDVLLKQAAERVSACHCTEGCLECCCDELCRQANVVMSKAGAEVVLRSLLGWDIDVDNLPWGPDEEEGAGSRAGIETVVPAQEVKARPGQSVRYIDGDVVEIKVEEVES
ncbi:hypothetical protein FH972_026155 [Carpinus fangiana]|uniref:Uncharacterized protein n=1 Tax=Carpinus fangiana TaxID=176857 RepID=A0A5N6L5R4_9ROSI|nr:hypothetical protein FH972_026155 [Carpinus fangiana]